jgi:outer membrane protein OmpA-like peptidoglycan-associated protein
MMKKFKLVFVLMFFSTVFYSQVNGLGLTPKEQKYLDAAKAAAAKGDNKKSIKNYESLLKRKPDYVPALLNLGGLYYSANSYGMAEFYFTKAVELSPDSNPEMYFSLGLALTQQKKYLPSAAIWKKYMSKELKNKEKLEKARRYYENAVFADNAFKNPVPFTPKNLGPKVNTPLSEYLPILSLDGSAIVFTRNVSQEDFYSSRLVNGQFQESVELRGMNTYQNEGAHSLSADGKLMVFTACDRRDAFGGCDLYFSNFENGAWSKAMNMGHVVNSAAWDSQPTLSPDGRTLYFASNRLGTLGGTDLWVTNRDPKGRWVTPINLGKVVNTIYNEVSPFLHGDGQTLYFTSDGHPGMGDKDIFISRKVKNEWTSPVNLGYPINTEGVEGPICVSLDGTTAYFSSDYDFTTNKRNDNLDILKFEMPTEARPKSSTYVKGVISDAVSKNTISAKIRLQNLATSEDIFENMTEQDGYYISSLPSGGKYAVIVEKEGYVFYTQHFDLSALTYPYKPYILDVALQPILVETKVDTKPVVLNNIFFETGSDVLLPESKTEIQLLTDLMTDNTTMRIKIYGHTDNVGSDIDNLDLSTRRAKAVANSIIKNGIDGGRLESEGLGETQPIDSNDTPEGRQKNRRTEFRVL